MDLASKIKKENFSSRRDTPANKKNDAKKTKIILKVWNI